MLLQHIVRHSAFALAYQLIYSHYCIGQKHGGPSRKQAWRMRATALMSQTLPSFRHCIPTCAECKIAEYGTKVDEFFTGRIPFPVAGNAFTALTMLRPAICLVCACTNSIYSAMGVWRFSGPLS